MVEEAKKSYENFNAALMIPVVCVFHSVAGDVKFWDPRFTESVRTLETIGNSAAFEVHHQAKVFATWVVSRLIQYWFDVVLMLTVFVMV